MEPMTVRELLAATDGKLLGDVSLDTTISGVETDSRAVHDGDLFVAIRGENIDGHQFITGALEGGALGCLTAVPPKEAVPGKFYVLVEDTVQALGQVARAYKAKFPIPVIGITGSVGKTTTKDMIASVLSQKFRVLKTEGNYNNEIGLPLTLFRLNPQHELCVLEMGMNHFGEIDYLTRIVSPNVAVITNISPNHLDVHKDMQEYIDAKRNIYLHQGGLSRTVLNADNEITASFVPQVRGMALQFSRRTKPALGAYLGEDGVLYMNDRKGTTAILPMDQIRIPGIHNVENYLAAISAVWGEVSRENIVSVAKSFPGVEHRIEFVRELGGVKWYNDSIASSPTRTIAGLNSFHQKIILIAGGYDKKIPFEPLAPKIVEKVKALILMGVTAPKIEAAVRACAGFDEQALPIYHVSNMQQAVEKAREIAGEGDIVSLSPACASFDLYPDFEARGRHFKELVNKL